MNFSQRDPRWQTIPLGTGGRETIGSAGCLITACASGLVDLGLDIDPGRINRWLARNNGYTGGNLLVFSAIDKISGLKSAIIDCSNIPAPIDTIITALDAGGFVVIKVDFRPGSSIQQHWVRVLEVHADDILIMDPWIEGPEQKTWLMAKYALPSWDSPRRAIFRIAAWQPDEMFDYTINTIQQQELSILH